MTATPDLVDIEAALVAYLPLDDGVAALVGEDVATELPDDFPAEGEPFVQLFRVSATDQGNGHVERAVIGLNAYGSTRPEAFDVYRAARRALLVAPAAPADGGVITAVETLSGPSWSPDPITGAPRFTGTVAVTAHP